MKRVLLSLALALAACGQNAPPDKGYGANPELGEREGGLPTVNPARAVGWSANGAPTAPAGFAVTRYAEGLDHPRWIYLLPNGDVLVAESSTEPETGGGVVGWIRNSVQRRAGALAGSANRITLLRDTNRDGVVDERHVFAEDLNQPIGMALVGRYFYVANTDAVVRFAYTDNAVRVPGRSETVLRLPHRDADNGHWTRTLAVSPDGAKLYVAVGSSSNIADNGMPAEEGRAAIWEFNPDGSQPRIFASGIRNPVGLEFEPSTSVLYVVANERDMLGDNLTPDYLTSVRDGGFYGWPYSYWGRHVDERVQPQRPDLVAAALTPDYALGSHTASLGLHFYRGAALAEHYRSGVFVGQHGSWNRSALAGYKVIFVPFVNGRPDGEPEDFLTGFLNDRGEAQGRPVGVGEDATGALLVADDVGNIIWRVAPN
ncbi:PQQ-dependent sugar dehydrogenase [Terricaulis sp.]|uniref:PQQ-dependent sugar dehydrogenase n=1 Tax=Terricaulis sp. TaxID=2768686 RepID=UPI00378486EE